VVYLYHVCDPVPKVKAVSAASAAAVHRPAHPNSQGIKFLSNFLSFVEVLHSRSSQLSNVKQCHKK